MNTFNHLVKQQIEEQAFRSETMWKQVSNPIVCLAERRIWDSVSAAVAAVVNSTLIEIDSRTWNV